MRYLACTLTITTALLGCSPDFEMVWKVTDLRVLAIRADPPEVLATQLDLGHYPKVTISALAVDPRDPDREVEWELWACTSDGNNCEEATRSERVVKQRSRLDKITAELAPSRSLFRVALEESPQRGFGGLPLMTELRIKDDKDKLTIRAVKRVVYGLAVPLSPSEVAQMLGAKGQQALPTGVLGGGCNSTAPRCGEGFECLQGKCLPGDGAWGGSCKTTTSPACGRGLECIQDKCLKRPNRNPSITKVTADNKTIDADWTVTARDEVTLLPVIDESDEEPWIAQTFKGAFKQLEEWVSFDFYTTSGALSHASTGGKERFIADDKKVTDITSDWRPGYPSKKTTLWIVAHDSRGGVGWTSLAARVEPRERQ